MTSPSILFIGSFLSAHMGTRSVGEDLAELLSSRGWRVYTTSSKPGRVSRMLDMLWTILRLHGSYDGAYLEVFSGLAFNWADICARWLAWLRKPVVLALHGGGLVEFAGRHPRQVAALFRRAELITTPSTMIQRGLTDSNVKIHHIPNGLDLAKYRFHVRDSAAPDLLWLRAFSHIYNPQMAVYALQDLTPRFPHAHLTMIGPDKKDGSLQAVQVLIEKTSMQGKVSIIGSVPKAEVGRRMQSADIFLNTTNFESYGVSLMEAAACGLCIVSTNVGELPYLWQDGVDALLVPPGDSAAMARAVERILAEPGLAAALSQNARRKAEQYDWASVLPLWEALFSEAVQPVHELNI